MLLWSFLLSTCLTQIDQASAKHVGSDHSTYTVFCLIRTNTVRCYVCICVCFYINKVKKNYMCVYNRYCLGSEHILQSISASNPCGKNGLCSGGMCKCHAGFEGDRCEKKGKLNRNHFNGSL